ncbi:type B 50S ribosomal protein L31 [Roseibacillus persicicus]|uniref:50S ribosomal protein L31 n=1 Tax=Roseibacillus persicicus TaxID=454148 RepID=A0A918WQR0_9BACT|nr:type B 50S ribosomal protein L31 [Roseibacillus persicicus]MDQ8189322.1 type B 50S ribosomal protein L31 [Roseibacillus persicicus]GHC65305.1 50S ribosomal protein L31 type B [Roseibacillus persicicus]
MKKDIHPDYHPTVFQDMTTGKRFITRSTVKSDKTEEIDGVEHVVVSMGITSDSHPFFTGKAQFVDTEGRIDKFQKRFGTTRRATKPKLTPKVAEAAPAASEEA